MKRSKGVLLLKDYDEVEEINLELDYLLTLSIALINEALEMHRMRLEQ
jgi:hypothetical protein